MRVFEPPSGQTESRIDFTRVIRIFTQGPKFDANEYLILFQDWTYLRLNWFSNPRQFEAFENELIDLVLNG